MKQLQLRGTTFEIACAIKRFPSQYHEDFVRTRDEAKKYLAQPAATTTAASNLARELFAALTNWGAGKRKAPRLLDERVVSAALQCKDRHKRLRDLARYSVSRLTIRPDGSRKAVGKGSRVEEFDELLFSSLRDASTAFFAGNTNVTYPMKTLLLINGQMPAFDSQVRNGLKKAGVKGVAGTQALMPQTPACAAARRICELPFVLGEVWLSSQEQIQKALQLAKRAELMQEPGRFFDMLLFVQGEEHAPSLLCLKD
jgi:hypothetical protein